MNGEDNPNICQREIDLLTTMLMADPDGPESKLQAEILFGMSTMEADIYGYTARGRQTCSLTWLGFDILILLPSCNVSIC